MGGKGGGRETDPFGGSCHGSESEPGRYDGAWTGREWRTWWEVGRDLGTF